MLSLEKSNYNSWSSFFNNHFGSIGLKKYIEDALTNTSTLSTLDPEWSKLDDLIKMWILGTLVESLKDQVVTTLRNAKDLLDTIKTLFHDNEDARAINIDNQICSIKMGNLSTNDYFTKIQSMADRLANLGSPVADKYKVMYALNGISLT
ncbi:hypothetical protein CTI12_AA236700 [Artemisia annua]|uniref:Hybrid signal transduction histidine kinase M n=1 Tax=Artemisia annua TaxID=35608 RepID=A0A2U1NSN8_ARTAN|nr:hypothetical protein CTI12_AA236700 [Artemisia annua]